MLASATSYLEYDGNVSTVTRYPVTFDYLDAAHILVGRKLTGETVFTPWVSGWTLHEDAPIGITTTLAQAATTDLLIYRLVPLTQPADFPGAGAFDPAGMEQALDRLTMIAQQQQRLIDGGDL